MNRSISIKELLPAIGQECFVVGSQDRSVSRPAPIDTAEEDSLCFCSREGERGLATIEATRARVIICNNSLDLSTQNNTDKTFIQVANPRLAFITVLEKHFVARPEYGIHPTAVIGERSKIHKQVQIGPNTVIDDDCTIDRGSVIGANVTIYPRTRIGKQVVVHAGVVIGTDGFGFERDATGAWVPFPHLGGVVIEDDVRIGPNTCIDRGALGDTIIGQGTKISNLVQISHNVQVGKRCIIGSLASLGGSLVVKDDAWLARTSSMREGLVIGRHSLVGMGAVVVKDVPDNVVVAGVPARVLRENK